MAGNQQKQPVPKHNDQNKLNPRQERNVIKDNMMKVIFDNSQAQKVKLAQQQKMEKEKELDTHKNYGKVPKYIEKFN